MSDELSVQGWRVWYADGSVYDSTSRAWVVLPSSGVLGVVVYYDEPYREIVAGGDWYWLEEDGKPACGETVWGGHVDPPEGRAHDELKRGEAVPDETYEKVRVEMMEARQWL